MDKKLKNEGVVLNSGLPKKESIELIFIWTLVLLSLGGMFTFVLMRNSTMTGLAVLQDSAGSGFFNNLLGMWIVLLAVIVVAALVYSLTRKIGHNY